MEKALHEGKIILAYDAAETKVYEDQIRLLSRNKQLSCTDPNCENPTLKYCHGDKKAPYFSHLVNNSCDYAIYDQKTPSIIREIKIALFKILNDKGYNVEMDIKLLPHHYSHLVITTSSGKKIAIELARKTTTIGHTAPLEKKYNAANIPLQWIIVGETNDFEDEKELGHIKRHALNSSTEKSLITISENATAVTQQAYDFNEYMYRGIEIYSTNYPKVFKKEDQLNSLSIGESGITISGFTEAFQAYIQKKRNAFEKKVAELKKQEEQKALIRKRQWKNKTNQYKAKDNFRSNNKPLIVSHVDPVYPSAENCPLPQIGMEIWHRFEGDLTIVNIEENNHRTLVTLKNSFEETSKKDWEVLWACNVIKIVRGASK